MVSTNDFPQADILSQVGLVAESIHNGKKSDSEIEQFIGLNSDGRQGRYYRLSAQILGLIKNDHNFARLTPLGEEYVKLRTDTAKNDFLARCLVETEVFKAALSYIHTHQPTNEQLKLWFKNFYPGAASTADRRFITFQRYLDDCKLVYEQNGQIFINMFLGGIVKKSAPDELKLVGRKYGQTKPPIFEKISRISFNIDRQKLERANQIHWKLVDAKSSFLYAAGFESFDNKHIDLFSRTNNDIIFYEMKSIDTTGTNTIPQIRAAIAQLYEYRYIFNEPTAKLCIVTNSKLENENIWISDYLSKDRLIAYEWTDDFISFNCDKPSQELLGEFFP